MLNTMKLKELRGYVPQYVIAKRAGISPNHYSQIEAGVRNPSLGASARIAKAFGVKIDDLMIQ